MAPTQILAEQHFLNARKWLDPLGVQVALRTEAATGWQSASNAAFRRRSDLKGRDGPQVVLGTHALLL